MSYSVRPYRRQPTRLPHPWDSPGKNTGVGCHFLLQCMKVKNESEVAQSCLTLSDPMDYSPPGSSIHGTLPALKPSTTQEPTSSRARYTTQILQQCRRPGFNPWLGKIAWRRAWQPTPVFLPAAAAKSLLSCPTLCDPIDGSLPDFPIPGILQARTLEWVAISFSNP